jgi:pyruvate carboxylase
VTKLKTKKQKIKEDNLDETITYLGDIQVDGKLYYALTSFRRILATLVKHGHSTIYILDSKKRIVKEYELVVPEELPFKLQNNSLYFHFKDTKTNKQKTYINRIEKELPELMCVAPDDCY